MPVSSSNPIRSRKACLTQPPVQNKDSRAAEVYFGNRHSDSLRPDAATSPLALPTYIGNPWWKRTVDVVGSLVLIGLLCPLMIAVTVYIKLVSRGRSKGPVFFCQRRIGAGGKHFTIIKFRTMTVRDDADAEHRRHVSSLTLKNAPIEKPDHQSRLIRGGKFLRRYSIDELPQLFNVLGGTMSLVGPRPDVLEIEDYRQWQLRRFEVLPGMTGLWQVSGKNRLSFHQMIHLDIEYVERRSFRLDIKVLWKTLAVVLQQDNA